MNKAHSTPRKEAILAMLEADYDAPMEPGSKHKLSSEFGRPPLSATTIAKYVDWFGGEGINRQVQQPDGEPEWIEVTDAKAAAVIVQSFARTLRGMVKEGLLVSVREKKHVLNAIAGDHIAMTQTCYFSARTRERDVARLQAIQDAENAEQARIDALTPEQRKAEIYASLDATFGAAPAKQAAPQLPGNVIDGCINEVSD